MMKITPSVASANQLYLADEMKSFGTDVTLHVDIEDGNFVPNITFGMRTIMSLAESFPNQMDYHLLTMTPSIYYEELAKTNARYVIIPFEVLRGPMVELDKIRDLGMKPGLSIEMHTPVEILKAFREEVDCVLLSTYGSPKGGMNGLGFRKNSLERIKQVREIMPAETDIIADGGIGIKELPLLKDAGTDIVVLGRLLFPEEVSEENGLNRVLLPKDRTHTPHELMNRILEKINGGNR